MAIEKVYSLKIEGADSVNDLRSAIEQLNDKLQTLNQTSKEYKETLEELTKLQGQLSDAMKGISDAAGSTNQSIDGIKESLNEMGEVINTVGGEVVDSFVDGFVQGMTEAASSITVVNTNLQDLSQIDSVKDLKGHISDLRDRLVTLENGSDDYKATVQELINAQVKLKEVMNAGKNEIEAAEGSYNALSQRMSALKQVWKETTDEATRNEIGQQINEINNELKALDASIGNSQRNVGNYKSALDGLDESFVGWKQELKECKDALQQLDPASQAYADTMARAAELTHNITEQQEMLKNASNDVGDVLTNVQAVGANLAAGFSALNAAMGLFGEENEEVQQAMLKVQQAMALVQGMQGLDGFFKNTKKLSTQLGLTTKATKANTIATRANATAAKADAVAMGAEATATKAVIPAQMGLNAAMKANPIGFIIGLVASLIAIFTLLKDKIMEMIGSNKEMSEGFDKVKAVLAGFGNVIKKSVINPIKLAIIPIKTLAKVLIDFFKGNWSEIGNDIKAGFEETKNTVVDTINVVGAFKEGYDKKTAEQNEAARKKEAAAREKDLEDQIKDNEAKYGSDWKYTKEAKKLYDEMFKARMAQYKEDSEEYKEAAREKARYEKEFRDNQAELAKNAAKAELEYKKALYGDEYEFSDEWHQKVLDGLTEAQKAYDKALKDYNDAEKKVIEDAAKQMGFDPNDPNLTIWVDMKLINPELAETLKQTKEILEENKKEVDAYEKRLDDYNKAQAQKRLSEYKRTLNDIKSNFEKFVPDVMREQWNFDDIIDKWEKSINIYKGYLKNTRKLTDEQVEEVVNDIRAKLVKTTNDTIAKALTGDMEKTLSQIEKNCNTIINEINTKFENKKILEGIKFPDEEIQHSKDVFVRSANVINQELELVRENINKVYEEFTKEDGRYFGMSEEQLSKELPEFQKLLDKEIELKTKQDKLFIQHFKEVSEIRLKAYDIEEAAITKRYEKELSDMQFTYDQEELLIQKRNEWYSGYNVIEGLKRQRDFQNSYYDELINMYQEEMRMYAAMAENEELTFEESMKARETFTKLQFETEKALQDKQKDDLKTSKQLIKEWVTAVKDATQSIADILGTIADSWSSLIDLESNAIQTELEEGKISETEAARRDEQNKKSFDDLKKFQIAQSIINTLAAAVSAYQSMASIPYVGPALGAAAAAAALVAGYAQVKQIQATSYGNGSSSSAGGGGGSSSTNFQLPSVLELEPDLQGRMTGMSDIDALNNGGRGRGESAIRAFVVESEISASQELANKRHQEVTF